jgi:hypothetical protein
MRSLRCMLIFRNPLAIYVSSNLLCSSRLILEGVRTKATEFSFSLVGSLLAIIRRVQGGTRSHFTDSYTTAWPISLWDLTYLLTELSPSWEATNCAATQELPSILWNPKVHHRGRPTIFADDTSIFLAGNSTNEVQRKINKFDLI